MSSEMCSLHLTHPSGAVGSRLCGARGAVGGSVPCSRVSPQSWTLPARAGIRTHNLGLPQVSSPTLYPLGHDCPTVLVYFNFIKFVSFIYATKSFFVKCISSCECFHGPDKQGVFCEILYVHFICLCALDVLLHNNWSCVFMEKYTFSVIFFYEGWQSVIWAGFGLPVSVSGTLADRLLWLWAAHKAEYWADRHTAPLRSHALSPAI